MDLLTQPCCLSDKYSISRVCELLEGCYKDNVPTSCFGCVDVNDVALAHVRGYEIEEAVGKRYIIEMLF